jgi:hypothetical protein
MTDENTSNYPHFTAEMAENGFILRIYYPEGQKSVEKRETRVFPDINGLLDDIKRIFLDTE